MSGKITNNELNDQLNTKLNNLDSHLIDNIEHPAYVITTNTGNAYSVTISNLGSLTDGLQIRVKFNVASTGAITININGLGAKNVVDYFGNVVTNVRANLIANLSYESTSGNFILLGKGGGGTAQPSEVLQGKTFTNDSGLQTGTIINRSGTTIGPYSALAPVEGTVRVIPSVGYYNGSDAVISWSEPNLYASNIASGKSILGVAGTQEGKYDISSYLNTSAFSHGITSFVNGEGIWVGGTGTASLYGPTGTLLNTVTCAPNTSAKLLFVSKDRMLWSNSSYVLYITNKSGASLGTIASFDSSHRDPVAVMHTATDRIYTICTDGSNYYAYVFNSAGTQIGSSVSIGSATCIWAAVTSGGAIYKPSSTTFTMGFINSAGASVGLSGLTPAVFTNVFA